MNGFAVVDFAYRSSSLHVALETTIAVISIVAAHLVHGRFRQSLARSDLVLFYALATFAVVNLVLSALPAALGRAYPHGFATWSPAAGACLGAALLLLASRTSAEPVTMTARRTLDQVAAGVIVITVVAAVTSLVALDLRPSATRAFAPERWSVGELPHHPDILLQLLASFLFFAAGWFFTMKAERGGEELMRWLAAGSIVAGFARFNYFFFPTLYSSWIYTGDVLRLVFYVVLFAAAAREISAYQQRAAAVAVLEERRRMARDLHDGLAQELAYITARTRRLAALTAEITDDRFEVEHLAAAAERALGESRRAIAALTQPIYQPLHIALAEEAQEIAARVGAELELDLDRSIEVDPTTRETLLRIVREAVTNAGRHGGADRIRVQLTNGEGLHLRVTDNGDGFDPGFRGGTGFGIVSMEERAHALGGRFTLASTPGVGTRIEVSLP
jgi:signal transduction histidine kinase